HVRPQDRAHSLPGRGLAMTTLAGTRRTTTSATRGAAVTTQSTRRRVGGHIATVAAWLVGLIFVLPVVLMVFVSFHSDSAGHATLNPIDLTSPLTLEGYAKFF